jgi:hypothetical protein
MTGRSQAEPEGSAALSAYLDRRFDLSPLETGLRLPLPDEPFVACWEAWAEEARQRGAAAVLADHLPQLAFPIREGISASEEYRAATRRGVPPRELPGATGLALERPEAIELELYPSPAGRVPVVVLRHREDFVTLVRALAKRNEPKPVPASQGAAMIAGYNNWTRLAELRRRWQARREKGREGGQGAAAAWAEELQRLQESHKELYQDRFMLLSDGPYSAVPAVDLGLGEAVWRELSLAIRRDHECAHYFTRRLFGSMKNHLHDELLADYAGLTAALGRFRADWFLRFLGLDTDPPRPDGRVHVYRGDPPVSGTEFEHLQELVRAAAAEVETFDRTLAASRTVAGRAVALAALASLPLAQTAAPGGARRLAGAFETIREKVEDEGGGGGGEEAAP